jgi:hypothetical protein
MMLTHLSNYLNAHPVWFGDAPTTPQADQTYLAQLDANRRNRTLRLRTAWADVLLPLERAQRTIQTWRGKANWKEDEARAIAEPQRALKEYQLTGKVPEWYRPQGAPLVYPASESAPAAQSMGDVEAQSSSPQCHAAVAGSDPAPPLSPSGARDMPPPPPSSSPMGLVPDGEASAAPASPAPQDEAKERDADGSGVSAAVLAPAAPSAPLSARMKTLYFDSLALLERESSSPTFVDRDSVLLQIDALHVSGGLFAERVLWACQAGSFFTMFMMVRNSHAQTHTHAVTTSARAVGEEDEANGARS